MKRKEDDYATIEHLDTRSDGGSDSLKNIRVVCHFCNNLRGSIDLQFFIRFMNYLKNRSTFVIHWHQLGRGEKRFIRLVLKKRYEHWQTVKRRRMQEAMNSFQ